MASRGTHGHRLLTGALLLALALGTAACAAGPASTGLTSVAQASPVEASGSPAATDAPSVPGASDPGPGDGSATTGGTASPRASTAAARTPSPGPATPTSPPSTTRTTAAPHPSTPRVRPSSGPHTTPAPTTAPVPRPGGGTVRSAKKGAALWSFDGVGAAFADSGASWYYGWSTSAPKGVGGGEFVPMIWGASSVTASALAQAKASGSTVLGFNEPDLGAQSNLTVDRALALWPQVQATGMRLVSPAVASGGDTVGGWLDRFMSGAAAKGYRVDAIALHWYGGDFTTSNAVSQLRSYVTAVWNRYHKPIWVTEYALMRFGPTVTPTADQQAAFVTASTAMLQGLSFVERYAWFSFPTPTEGGLGTGLYSPGGVPTAMGLAYRKA